MALADRDRRIAGGLFLLAFVSFAWFYGGAGWNQDAHLALTRALVERGTLHVDGYESTTGDLSTGVDGRTYINKAPGVSFPLPNTPQTTGTCSSSAPTASPFW